MIQATVPSALGLFFTPVAVRHPARPRRDLHHGCGRVPADRPAAEAAQPRDASPAPRSSTSASPSRSSSTSPEAGRTWAVAVRRDRPPTRGRFAPIASMVSSSFDERAGACSFRSAGSRSRRWIRGGIRVTHRGRLRPRPVRGRVDWLSVVEALDEVVLLLNSRYVVTYASPAVAHRLGHAPNTWPAERWVISSTPTTCAAHCGAWRRSDRRSGAAHDADPARGRRVRAAGVVADVHRERRGRRRGGPRPRRARRHAPGSPWRTGSPSADQRSRALLSALTEAVVFLDGQLRVEEVNDRAASLLGLSPHDLLGHRWFEVLDVEDENGRPLAAEPAFAVSLLTEPTGHGVWRSIRRGDGQRVTCSAGGCRSREPPGSAGTSSPCRRPSAPEGPAPGCRTSGGRPGRRPV